ncbi:MAG: hypothetical protein ABSH32_35305 [Bryobacteraceae bacterium]
MEAKLGNRIWRLITPGQRFPPSYGFVRGIEPRGDRVSHHLIAHRGAGGRREQTGEKRNGQKTTVHHAITSQDGSRTWRKL